MTSSGHRDSNVPPRSMIDIPMPPAELLSGIAELLSGIYAKKRAAFCCATFRPFIQDIQLGS